MVNIIDKSKHKGDYGYEVDVMDRLCFCRPCYQPHDWWHDDRYVCAHNHRQGCPKPIPPVESKNHIGKRICKRCGTTIS